MHKAREDDDRGSATVEFLAATLLLLVPIIYLIVTLAAVQGATYAAEASARHAGRVFARANDETRALAQVHHATYLAFADHGIDVSPASILDVSCEHDPCLSPGAGMHFHVEVQVPLPLIPDFIAARLPASVRVTADAFTTIDRFGG